MYLSSKNSSKGLIHGFYSNIDYEDYDLKEIADLISLLSDYYTFHTGKKSDPDIYPEYFSNLLNIEVTPAILLKIARVLERNQLNKDFILTNESLVGIGA